LVFVFVFVWFLFSFLFSFVFVFVFIWFLFLFSFGFCFCYPGHNAKRFHIELIVRLGEKTQSGFAGNAAPKIKLILRKKEAPAWP
jgi:hypothetical protein